MEEFTDEELKQLGFQVEDEDAADLAAKLGMPIEDEDAPEAAPVEPAAPAGPRYDSTMYNTPDGGQMPFEQGMQTYAEALKDPNVTKPIGGLGYAVSTDPETGETKMVPPPSQSSFRPLRGIMSLFQNGPEQAWKDTFEPRTTVGIMDLIAMGAAETAGDMATFGAAVGDKLFGTNATGAVDSAMPNVDTGQDLTDSLIADGVPALLTGTLSALGVKSALAGTSKAVSTAPKLVKTVVDAVKAFGITVAGEVGAAATVGTDEGTIFLGENAALPLGRGLDLGDEASDKVLEQRFNTMVEGMFLASTLLGGAATAKGIAGFSAKAVLTPLTTVVSGPASMERRMYEDIMSNLVAITDASTPEQIDTVRREIARVVQANKDISIPMLNDIAADPPTLTYDTVSALLRGLEDNPEMSARATGLRAGMMNRGPVSASINAALQRPKARMEADINEYLKSVGGDTTDDQTKTMLGAADEFANQGKEFVETAGAAVGKAEQDFDKASLKLLEDYKTDVEFGQKIIDLERRTGTEIVQPGQDSLENVKLKLEDAYVTMKDQNSINFAAVSGGEVDVETLLLPLDDILDIESISKAGVAVKSNSPLRTLLNISKRREVPDIDTAGNPVLDAAGNPTFRRETDDERVVRVNKTLVDNQIDFGFFFRQIRPELSQVADNLFTAGTPAAGRQVRDLVQYIDGPLLDSVRASDPTVADSADAALKYYKEEFAPIWRGGKLGEFANLVDGTIGRTDGTDLVAQVTGKRFGENAYQEGRTSLVTGIMQSGNPDQVKSLSEAISTIDQPDDIMDYMLFKAFENVDPASDPAVLVGQLKNYSASMRKAFPAKADSLDAFIGRVEGSYANKENAAALVTEMAAKAREAKDQVLRSELSNFIQQNPFVDDVKFTGWETTSDPYEAFKSIFGNRAEGTAITIRLMDAANQLPTGRREAVVEGIETAYMKYLNDRIFAATPESGGVAAIKIGPVSKALEGLSNDIEVGRAIFADQPAKMQTLEMLMDAANFVDKNKRATPNASMSPTVFNKEATEAVSRGIAITLGPLNRLATRVRSASGMIIDKMDSTNKAQLMLGRLFADPDYFMELARRFGDTPSNEFYEKAFSDFIANGRQGSLTDVASNVTAGLKPIDTQNRDILTRNAVSGYLKTDQDDASAEVGKVDAAVSKVDTLLPDFLTPQFLQDELNAMGQAVDGVRGAVQDEWLNGK